MQRRGIRDRATRPLSSTGIPACANVTAHHDRRCLARPRLRSFAFDVRAKFHTQIPNNDAGAASSSQLLAGSVLRHRRHFHAAACRRTPVLLKTAREWRDRGKFICRARHVADPAWGSRGRAPTVALVGVVLAWRDSRRCRYWRRGRACAAFSASRIAPQCLQTATLGFTFSPQAGQSAKRVGT